MPLQRSRWVPCATTCRAETRSLYDTLEDRILARDQVGASEAYYGLVQGWPPAARDHRRGGADSCAADPRALSRAHRPGLREFRQQRPLSVVGSSDDASRQPAAAAPCRAADGPDRLVHPHRARHLEPEDQQGAGPLRAKRQAARRPAGQARRPLARPGARAHRGLDRREAGSLARSGSSRPCAGGLSRLPRHHGRAGASQGGPGAARLCRAHRPAGPRIPQQVLHHRPQILPRPGHGRARQFRRLGQCPSRDLRGRARHRRRPALVLDLRDGVQLHHPLHREAEDIGNPLRRQHDERG